jgi:hypothetical protein
MNDELDNLLEAIMADPIHPGEKMWNTIASKVKGQYQAYMNMPMMCETCEQPLHPFDVGVDPATNERLWITYCCGESHKFIEKIGFELP